MPTCPAVANCEGGSLIAKTETPILPVDGLSMRLLHQRCLIGLLLIGCSSSHPNAGSPSIANIQTNHSGHVCNVYLCAKARVEMAAAESRLKSLDRLTPEELLAVTNQSPTLVEDTWKE